MLTTGVAEFGILRSSQPHRRRRGPAAARPIDLANAWLHDDDQLYSDLIWRTRSRAPSRLVMAMPEPPSPSIALLWPALAALSVGEMASEFAEQWGRFAGVVEPGSALGETAWATENRVTLELPTMRLRDFSSREAGYRSLVCAPFALHQATIADFAPGHSLMAALRAEGISRLWLTQWRSASTPMRFFSIDTYLSDLNVAVDELGGRADLIGLCQGGWMALMFAARFPAKVRRLVLVGAPIDLGAGESSLSRLAAAVPLAAFRDLVRLGGGRILGARLLDLWGGPPLTSQSVREVLQLPPDLAGSPAAVLEAAFRDWYGRTVDLPGQYYLEVVDRLFKRNLLAQSQFVALGRRIDLGAVRAPMFLLAAREDEVIAPAQVFATAERVGTPACDIRTASAPGRHLSLFLGAQTLKTVWPDIARWLTCEARLPHLQELRAAASVKRRADAARRAEH
jgi:poly(3-hydroxyalkanoate) synthetase